MVATSGIFLTKGRHSDGMGRAICRRTLTRPAANSHRHSLRSRLFSFRAFGVVAHTMLADKGFGCNHYLEIVMQDSFWCIAEFWFVAVATFWPEVWLFDTFIVFYKLHMQFSCFLQFQFLVVAGFVCVNR